MVCLLPLLAGVQGPASGSWGFGFFGYFFFVLFWVCVFNEELWKVVFFLSCLPPSLCIQMQSGLQGCVLLTVLRAESTVLWRSPDGSCTASLTSRFRQTLMYPNRQTLQPQGLAIFPEEITCFGQVTPRSLLELAGNKGVRQAQTFGALWISPQETARVNQD